MGTGWQQQAGARATAGRGL